MITRPKAAPAQSRSTDLVRAEKVASRANEMNGQAEFPSLPVTNSRFAFDVRRMRAP